MVITIYVSYEEIKAAIKSLVELYLKGENIYESNEG